MNSDDGGDRENLSKGEEGYLSNEARTRRRRDKVQLYSDTLADDGYDSGLLREEAKGLLEAEGAAASGAESDRSFGLIN